MAKITQITVEQMQILLAREVIKGNGKKYLVLSNDSEGNGFHGCFFGISPVDDIAMELISDSQVMDQDKLMMIG